MGRTNDGNSRGSGGKSRSKSGGGGRGSGRGGGGDKNKRDNNNRNKSSNGKGDNKGKKKPHKGKPTFTTANPPRRHKKLEVNFNSSERHDYLTGFSARKKERRAFGLAMQKVKDRQAKLEERKESREAQLEKIEDIERSKETLRKGVAGLKNDDDGGGNAASDDDDDDGIDGSTQQHAEQEMKTFGDEHTTHQFGGLVSVTTTFGIPSDDEDEDDIVNSKNADFYAREKHGANHVDEAQQRAGNVNKYMAEVKGTMGQRKSKNSGGGGGRKGQHGASTMKGMGNGTTLKMAKKTLAKFKSKGGKGGSDERGSERGGKGKKRKGRR